MKEVVVYTYGVFDLFHRGHVELLKEAKALGTKLIVGVFTDEIAEGFKRKPVISYRDRLAVIEACKYVDGVMVQDEFLPDKNLRILKPNILTKGEGAGWGDGLVPPGSDVIKELNGRVIVLDYHRGISTSEIIKKIN